jgi:thiamine pyrophosphate-dependent acetolactate synthase large subunit-like protein
MTRMTGGDAIVDSLLRHGVDTIFGLPGVQMYGLFDAFARNANRLKVVNRPPAVIEVISDIAKDYPPYAFHQPRLR